MIYVFYREQDPSLTGLYSLVVADSDAARVQAELDAFSAKDKTPEHYLILDAAGTFTVEAKAAAAAPVFKV